jgi:beta-glucosidase/6-phospho-beta-glucosidase/beta-galactosidase
LNSYRTGSEWSRVFPKSTSNIEVGVERASDGNIARIDVGESALEDLEKIANKEAVNHYRRALKFGLYSVDSETKLRKSRKSAEVLKNIIKGRVENVSLR